MLSRQYAYNLYKIATDSRIVIVSAEQKTEVILSPLFLSVHRLFLIIFRRIYLVTQTFIIEPKNKTTVEIHCGFAYPTLWIWMAGAEGLEVASQPRLRCPATRCIRISLADRGTSLRSLHPPPAALATSPGTRFWRQSKLQKTVQIVPIVEPCLSVAKSLIFAYDALLMLLKNLCKIECYLNLYACFNLSHIS